MNGPKDGGPAFPHEARDNGPGNIKGRPHDGMSLRDWFAGQVIGSVYADGIWKHTDGAKEAYAIADAMLAVREVKP